MNEEAIGLRNPNFFGFAARAIIEGTRVDQLKARSKQWPYSTASHLHFYPEPCTFLGKISGFFCVTERFQVQIPDEIHSFKARMV